MVVVGFDLRDGELRKEGFLGEDIAGAGRGGSVYVSGGPQVG